METIIADPITRSGSNYSSPRDSNRVPALFGVSTVDGITPVALEVNPANGQLQTSGSGGGGGGTQYASGTTTPSPVTGNALIYDNSGILQNVSVANPLPVSATISTAGLATSANQTNGQQNTQITDVNSVESQNFSPGTPNSSGNAQIVAGTTESHTFSVTSVSTGTIYDVGNYASVSVHIVSQYIGTTPTITFQTSNNGTNFVSIALINTASESSAATVNATGGSVVYEGALRGRYFRLNFTGAYSSGTAAGTIVFSTASSSPVTMQTSSALITGFTTATGTITTSSSAVISTSTSSVGGFALISIHGTYSGVSFGITQSDDSGTTFYTVPIYDAMAQAWLAPGTTITPGTNASKNYWVPVTPASSEIKVLSSAFTSGSASVRIAGTYTSMPGSFMNQIMDAAGNSRGANVNTLNALDTDTTSINGNAVATVASGVQAVGINDGTYSANVVGGDTGFNGVATASATKTYSFSTSASGAQTILANTPTEGFSWIEVVYTSVGVGLALAGQFSPTNGGTYVNGQIFNSSGNGSTGNSLGTTIGTIYSGPIRGNFFQIAVSALTSGTFSGNVTLRALSPVQTAILASQNGTWTVGSNSATGSAVPANAFYIAGLSSSGNLGGLSLASNAGAQSTNSTGVLATGNWQYNGVTYDSNRNNVNAVIVASGTTIGQSVTTTTYNARFATITVNVSAYTSGTINLTINILTSSGYSYSPFTSITGLAATGTVVYRIGPGLTAVAGLTANDMLGRSLQVITSGTFSATYGIDVNLGN